MSRTITVQFDKPIISAKVIDDFADSVGSKLPDSGRTDSGAGDKVLMQDLEGQKAAYIQAYETLNGIIARLNQFCEKLYAGHREEIARLSVEIARKILVQKVENGDYEIESIIKEALKNTPDSRNVKVHLNPEDIEKCRKAQQDGQGGVLTGIELIADPNVGRAECVLESPKGIIKSMIDDNLERIGKALKKAN